MKNEIAYICEVDIEPLIGLEQVVELMIANLAKKTQILFLNGNQNKVASLPSYYKQVIEKIMYEENGWGIRFSKLIDIRKYYDKQSNWESDLSEAINRFLEKYNKEINYSFSTDTIRIELTPNEIENIFSKYEKDEDILELMDHFTNLIQAPDFNRNFNLELKEMRRFQNNLSYNHEVFMKKNLGKELYEQIQKIKKRK